MIATLGLIHARWIEVWEVMGCGIGGKS